MIAEYDREVTRQKIWKKNNYLLQAAKIEFA